MERSAASATAAMLAAAESLQSHLDFVLDDRVGSLTADQRRFLDLGWRHGRRLLKLIEDLRDVTLAFAGQLELDRVPCDAAALIEKAVEAV